jgi:serine/threonine protein kinase/tetratricopeptide (TPR) repeat protein
MSSSLLDSPGPSTLAQRLADEMRQAWQEGARPRAEDYLDRYPLLWDHPEAATELIYEECCLRREDGQPADSGEILGRFPQWAGQLRVLLDCHRALEGERAGPDFPQAGDSLGDFRLLSELGRGRQGRVFLAAQPALDRPVVLKLTGLLGGEHLTLARLQHTHIVPLYSASEDLQRHLRILCLPYFGGASLAALLKALQDCPPERRRGADLLRVLDHAQPPELTTKLGRGPARDWLARVSYVEAICWIGACLAGALHYAHERGLIHLDVKPSNVLLAADCSPMLLDFHLAQPPLAAGSAIPAWLGGTPAYFSPEQAAAMEAMRHGGTITTAVDGRSDVYALGVVLYEALAGTFPASEPARTLRRLNPNVSVGLADLITRCLEPRPALRYPDAASLAEDLRRHLRDQPLRGVGNRDPRERWRKWRRRRPHALLVLGLLLLGIAGAVMAGAHVVRQLDKGRSALDEGREKLRQRHYAEAAAALERGLVLVEDLPFGRGLADDLANELRLARRAKAAGELHTAAERIRGLHGGEALPREQLQSVEQSCQAIWERHGRITDGAGADLPPEMEQQVKNDLIELAVLRATLRVFLAPSHENPAARQKALHFLADVEHVLGPGPVLAQARLLHVEALGQADRTEEARRQASRWSPRTAWEHYAVGCCFVRGGKLESAADELARAVELEPGDLWANFYRGRCAYQLGRHREALVAFSGCVALAPRNASCFYNLGLAQEALGQINDALSDYDRALLLEPNLGEALLSRGLLHARSNNPDAAVRDLQGALAQGAAPASVHHGFALVALARNDPVSARISLDRALRYDPNHKPARELRDSIRESR